MIENLVIVESPAKAKTIEKFLGNNFLVKSSFGHIRDLEKKDFGIDLQNNFAPKYTISADKKKLVAELKKFAKDAKTVWLASDEDREGEAIAWHLFEVLKLKKENTKRIVFHEITKTAILNAIENPRDINEMLVNAQQARRVLDRLVGFEISPVLWKKVKPQLSAGRVQSVAVRLLVEREREVIAFKPETYYKTQAHFLVSNENDTKKMLQAEYPRRFSKKEEVLKFLETCKNAKYTVKDIEKKPSLRKPAPPFTTSTLQQEASRKLGFSVAQTMSIAQRLYESGNITYMRTDSVNLSNTALKVAQKTIGKLHGDDYVKIRKYQNKNKSAQEAHEAIRPTYLNREEIHGDANELRLYKLIWQRTIASQMSDAKLEKTNIKIEASTNKEVFIASGEMIKFDGFLKVYMESTDEEGEKKEEKLLPNLNLHDSVQEDFLNATQHFTHHLPRYTEASLVKKLEELGIGRPSTYAPTITTIQNRGYVVKESREGTKRKFEIITLQHNRISEKTKTQVSGTEKRKLFPTDIGMLVTDFLKQHFPNIMSYNFTAEAEKEFDEIALGKIEWSKMIGKFYHPFHENVEKTLEHSERFTGERILGTDPKTGQTVLVRIGRYGPIAQIGEKTENETPRFASLKPEQHIESIQLEEALDLFKLPRSLGMYLDKEVVVSTGRFGPYVRHDGKFASLKKDIDDPMEIDLNRAIELIEEKREKDRLKFIKAFDEDANLQILNGRWGPYISYNKKNFRLSKEIEDPKSLSFEDCLKIVNEKSKKKTTRKATNKKK